MRILGIIILGLLLVGCSQTPNSTTRTKTIVDDQYVATVEQAAQQASVDVIWVNPPTKKVGHNQ